VLARIILSRNNVIFFRSPGVASTGCQTDPFGATGATVVGRVPQVSETEVVEVAGQKEAPEVDRAGLAAPSFTMWGFTILMTTILGPRLSL